MCAGKLVSSLRRHFKCIKLQKNNILFFGDELSLFSFSFSVVVLLVLKVRSRLWSWWPLFKTLLFSFSPPYPSLSLSFVVPAYLLRQIDFLPLCVSWWQFLSLSFLVSLPPVNQSNQLSDRDSSGSTPFSFYLKNGRVGKRGQIRAKRKKERRNTVVEAMQINLSIYTIFLLLFCLPN